MRWKTRKVRGNLRFGEAPRKRLNLDWVPDALKWLFQIAIVCFIAFVAVWYFGQRISAVGDSMNPVLENGDVVLVNRIVYDATSPKRGDIVVFRPNGNENLHAYIKRIIGLPGETVRIEDDVIYIDGEPLDEREYEVTGHTDAGLASEEITLAGDEFFVLGDNRENSDDSRIADIGNVKRSDIEGKAWFVVSPWERFGFLS